MKRKPTGYKKYEAVRNALSNLIDEYGIETTLQSMSDELAAVMDMDALTMVVESIKVNKTSVSDDTVYHTSTHKQKVKDGYFRKQLIDKGIKKRSDVRVI